MRAFFSGYFQAVSPEECRGGFSPKSLEPSLKKQRTSDFAQSFIHSLAKMLFFLCVCGGGGGRAVKLMKALRTQPTPKCQMENRCYTAPPSSLIFSDLP